HKKPPIPTPAKKVPAFNIEKRNDRLYEIDYLHKWFAISSLLLFGFTVWMILADYSREWKKYQRQFNRMQIQRTQQDMTQASGALDRNKYNQLEAQLKQAQADQKQNEKQLNDLQKKKDDITNKAFGVNQNYKTVKAIYDQEKYEYEEALANKRSDVEKLHTRLLATEKTMNDYKAQADQLTFDLQGVNTQLAQFVGKRDDAQKGIDTL